MPGVAEHRQVDAMLYQHRKTVAHGFRARIRARTELMPGFSPRNSNWQTLSGFFCAARPPSQTPVFSASVHKAEED